MHVRRQTWEWALPHDTSAPGIARQHVHEALGPDARLEDAQLIVTELATNAVVHGRAPVTLRLDRAPGLLRIEVADSGSGHASTRRPQMPAPLAPSGRGLLLVSRLAQAWGGQSTDQGWLAWATLSSSDSGSPAQRGLGS